MLETARNLSLMDKSGFSAFAVLIAGQKLFQDNLSLYLFISRKPYATNSAICKKRGDIMRIVGGWG